MRRAHRTFCLLGALVLTFPPRFVAAQASVVVHDDAEKEARALFERGVKQASQDDLEGARLSLEASLALVDKSATRLNLAIVLVRMSRFVEAHDSLSSLLMRAELEPRARSQAEGLLEQVEQRLHVVTLDLSPEQAEVTIDGIKQAKTGKTRAFALLPGRHHLEITHDGFDAQVLDLNAARGVKHEQSISLARRAPQANLAVVAEAPTLPPSTVAPTSQTKPRALTEADVQAESSRNVRRWAWITAGIALVGAGVLTALLVQERSPEPVAKPSGAAGTIDLNP